jgi:hypothetical protein
MYLYRFGTGPDSHTVAWSTVVWLYSYGVRQWCLLQEEKLLVWYVLACVMQLSVAYITCNSSAVRAIGVTYTAWSIYSFDNALQRLSRLVWRCCASRTYLSKIWSESCVIWFMYLYRFGTGPDSHTVARSTVVWLYSYELIGLPITVLAACMVHVHE